MYLNRYGLVDSNLVDLVEVDERLRQLERAASSGSSDDLARYFRHAQITGKAGEVAEHYDRHLPEFLTDRGLAETHPERQRIIDLAREAGAHDIADHLAIRPHARRFQDVSAQTVEGRWWRLDETQRQFLSAVRAAQAQSHRLGFNDISYGARFLDPAHAPDPPEHPNSGYGLLHQLIHWHYPNNNATRAAGEILLPQEYESHHNSWDDSDTASDSIKDFRDSLDYLNLGKISSHHIYLNDPPPQPYPIRATHHIVVDPVSRSVPEHVVPVFSALHSRQRMLAGSLPNSFSGWGPYHGYVDSLDLPRGTTPASLRAQHLPPVHQPVHQPDEVNLGDDEVSLGGNEHNRGDEELSLGSDEYNRRDDRHTSGDDEFSLG